MEHHRLRCQESTKRSKRQLGWEGVRQGIQQREKFPETVPGGLCLGPSAYSECCNVEPCVCKATFSSDGLQSATESTTGGARVRRACCCGGGLVGVLLLQEIIRMRLCGRKVI